MHVSSGRNTVTEASLCLYPASDGIALLQVPTLACSKQVSNAAEDTATKNEINLESYEAVALPAFGPNETLAITIPYETHMDSSEHHIKLAVHYLTPNSKRHAYTLTAGIDTLLPLQISHSIIWRDDW